MAKDTALIKKREELKRRLAEGEYKTLVDVVLTGANHLLQKITRRTKPFSIWLIMTLLIVVFTLIVFATIYIAGEFTATRNFMQSFGYSYELGVLITLILPSILNIMGLVLINQNISRIFVLWDNEILDATETTESLEQFEDWLEKVRNRRLNLLFAIVVGFLCGFYMVVAIAHFGVFIGYGLALTIIFLLMLGFAFIYLFFMVILLSASLRRYNLSLFAADPANSELVSRLSGVLSIFIYFYAVYAAYLTLVATSLGLLPSLGLIAVLILWVPLISIFILNQMGLSSMIRRVKWKTLNEMQTKVEKLQAAKNFGDKETMDAVNRLMDYHDRVKATRDSALNLGSVLSFINSLLLPLLAFLLGNLDKLIALVTRQP
jgi:hypothetical protein